ncbi:MAG: phage protein GemA/Gp16 family protein [Smithella sp.]
MAYPKTTRFIPINGNQITVIKMAQKALGITDDNYRDMLEDRYRVRSCTNLSYLQARAFIAELEKKGFTLKPPKGIARTRNNRRRVLISRRKGESNVVVMVTPDEIDKVNAVSALIKWQYEDGLQRFLAARMGIKDGKILTGNDAYLAIEGLKKLFENYMKKVHGSEWWTMRFADPQITEYIRIHCPEEYRY